MSASCYYGYNTSSTSCGCSTSALVATSGSFLPSNRFNFQSLHSITNIGVTFNAYWGAPPNWRGGNSTGSMWVNATIPDTIILTADACGMPHTQVTLSATSSCVEIEDPAPDPAPGIGKFLLVWWPAYQFYDASNSIISVPAGAATSLESGTITLPPLPVGTSIITPTTAGSSPCSECACTNLAQTCN